MKRHGQGLSRASVRGKIGAVPGVGRPEPIRAAMGPLCVGLVVLAACSSGSKPGGSATVPSAAATAASTTADPWAIPSTITPAYLDRVLAELNHIDGNAFRDARAHNAVTQTYVADERAIRASPHEIQLREDLVNKDVAIHWAGVANVPGDRRMTATSILTEAAPCVLAAVSVDFAPITVGPPQKYPPWYVALVPRASTDINLTHWALADDGFEPNGEPPTPAHACAVS